MPYAGQADRASQRPDGQEDELRGRPATAETFRVAIDAELRDAGAGEEDAYKIPLATRTVVAVLADLAEGVRR